ncbi:twin-arginine translocase subunit TatC [Spirilliplanes yamanashiensis]|uniref:Sec-independent protein translocase protein TatC n=1 Tax=Spirilliplanes yamanashiensis TaxID=42233 RepID=A0A8J3YBH3_9ACTN|nr:twin-arginine translocase subunit TatC [Spirilliplanes yamanashiensis]MDP9817863.1 sec-independent protein translocase protein TatC [Spirilliplanes yamanashiensis]GIJ04673.1 Sec-independent protein translocase protein TatC [Spirilliplanes yamanashiensis]
MALTLRRKKGPSKFEQASDGSMTLMEHLIELRSRLFKAALAVVAGLIAGLFLAQPVFELLKRPYEELPGAVGLVALGPTDPFTVKLQLAMWIGLLVGSPVWMYQMWAFVAPGLHRHERKWAYVFVALAVPLFFAGAVLAWFVVDKSLFFLIDAGIGGLTTSFEAKRYIDFVTTMLLLFGVAFEFPLLLLMLNFTGVVTARRLASWWRAVIFICTLFAAIVTPDPGVFGMLTLAGALSLLYFMALGVAFINDRRKGRGKELYAGLDDDELSPLEDDRHPVSVTDRIDAPEPVPAPEPVARPMPLERRYDEST